MLVFIINLIIFSHFLIVLFITSLIFLIPIGYRFNWEIFKNKILRLLHLLLMTCVTLEAILGITCPLTSFESYLSGTLEEKTFISYWLGKIIYWNFPSLFFGILYSLCLAWIIIMWKIYPPKNNKVLKKF